MDLQGIRTSLVTILRDRDITLTLTKERFNEMLRLSTLRLFKEKLGLPEQYQPGMPLPAQAHQITALNTQDLRPFAVTMGEDNTAPLWIDSTGLADIPTNFYYPSIMSYRYVVGREWTDRPVEIVTDLEWQARISDPLEYGDKKYPIANFMKDKIRFQPLDLRRVFFKYFTLPPVPFYSYKYDSNKGINVYDAATSVQTDWDDENQSKIVFIMLELLGVKQQEA